MKRFVSCFLALGTFVACSYGQSDQSGNVTVKGEVLDMACYLEHGAHGEGHAACAAKCIRSGLPVGIKSEDGQVYLLIGQHNKPLNDQLADYAGKTITVEGKVTTRDGISVLQNTQIVKD